MSQHKSKVKIARPYAPSYYRPSAADVAPRLLGTVLVSRLDGALSAGRIVEVEAYVENDAACHANRGQTKRNAAMFGLPGRAYVYQIHRSLCLNFVCRRQGRAEAVLIRAIEPLEGFELMQQRRGGAYQGRMLASGPGRLCQALGITREHDGCALQGPEIFVLRGSRPKNIVATPRIGISQNTEALLRFVDADSAFLSKRLR